MPGSLRKRKARNTMVNVFSQLRTLRFSSFRELFSFADYFFFDDPQNTLRFIPCLFYSSIKKIRLRPPIGLSSIIAGFFFVSASIDPRSIFATRAIRT